MHKTISTMASGASDEAGMNVGNPIVIDYGERTTDDYEE